MEKLRGFAGLRYRQRATVGKSARSAQCIFPWRAYFHLDRRKLDTRQSRRRDVCAGAGQTAPAGCTTNAVIRLSDGTSAVNLRIAAVANDSGVITENYAAGAKLTISANRRGRLLRRAFSSFEPRVPSHRSYFVILAPL